MNKSDNIKRIKNMLDRNNRISVKIPNTESATFRNMDQLILLTLRFYGLEVWSEYFCLLTRGLIHFAMDSCKLDSCSVRLIKEERAFNIQIHSDHFNRIISKREFIGFINDLSDKIPESDLFTDLLFFKKLFEMKQIETDNITYSTDTIELSIPDSKLTGENWVEIRNSVISSIDDLPPLKENLFKLEEMIQKGTFDMNTIAEQVGTDPALTMDILKIVNSGAYLLHAHVDDIHSALKYLGLRELYNLMFTLSVKNVLSVKNDKMRDFWYHSYKCAHYACRIASALHVKVAHTDSIYTAGLLHDIGKFPISMIFNDQNSELMDYCIRYQITLSDIEDALSGIGHCETGFLMAEKWKIPDSLKLVMRYHHEPDSAPEKVRSLNDIVYLADCLVYSESGRFNLENIDRSVLKRNGLKQPEDLKEILGDLSAHFDKTRIWD